MGINNAVYRDSEAADGLSQPLMGINNPVAINAEHYCHNSQPLMGINNAALSRHGGHGSGLTTPHGDK